MTYKFNDFCYYVAGLWEGDGHCGSIPNPYIAITFNKKDYPLCLLLKYIFNARIRYKNAENACVLTIQKRRDVFFFTQLIGDKLRTPKAIEIWEIARWLEKRFESSSIPLSLNSQVSLLKYSLDESPLNQNAWLAGYIDADGGFKVRFTRKKVNFQKVRIALSFIIEQRMVHKKSGLNMKFCMKNISDFLRIPLSIRKHNKKEYYCVELSSFSKLSILIEYLQKYSLLSSKHLDYLDWLDVYYKMVQQTHLIEEGKHDILTIKNGMNAKRTKFNWSHLLTLFCFVVIEMEINYDTYK